jgi:hypothetical protein
MSSEQSLLLTACQLGESPCHLRGIADLSQTDIDPEKSAWQVEYHDILAGFPP